MGLLGIGTFEAQEAAIIYIFHPLLLLTLTMVNTFGIIKPLLEILGTIQPRSI
jgi:hypothetical protein